MTRTNSDKTQTAMTEH